MREVSKGNIIAEAHRTKLWYLLKPRKEKNESVVSQIHWWNCVTIKLESIGGDVTRKYPTLRTHIANLCTKRTV